jgi:hypothetical protein
MMRDFNFTDCASSKSRPIRHFKALFAVAVLCCGIFSVRGIFFVSSIISVVENPKNMLSNKAN